MPKWLPLLGGMTAFVLVIVVLLIWLIFGGATGKQRGMVIVNLRATESIVTLDDGQSQRIEAGASKTMFAIKKDFPQTLHVTDEAGAAIFSQTVEYTELVDAEFRIAVDDTHIVFPVKPLE